MRSATSFFLRGARPREATTPRRATPAFRIACRSFIGAIEALTEIQVASRVAEMLSSASRLRILRYPPAREHRRPATASGQVNRRLPGSILALPDLLGVFARIGRHRRRGLHLRRTEAKDQGREQV